jgi:hypothetical protein
MLNKWHDWLAMPRENLAWHRSDIDDELTEYEQEKNLFKKWSELSDIVYTSTRAQWTDHKLDFPLSKSKYFIGLIYMYPKYSSRFLFFKRASKKAGAKNPIHEVRNPKRIAKLEEIAGRNGLDKDKFLKVCKNQLRFWPLLP